jgi:hypothetical protein
MPVEIPSEDTVKDEGPELDMHVDPAKPNSVPEAEAAGEPQRSTARAGWPIDPRPAKSLVKLRSQVNAKWPDRSRISDGLVGDDNHCHGGAPSTSDHCAWVDDGTVGVVTAFDITNDPAIIDSETLAQALLTSRDPRIKYIISRRRIVSSYPVPGSPSWTWRPYTGSDPHTSHLHLSVNSHRDGSDGYDDTSDWEITSPSA